MKHLIEVFIHFSTQSTTKLIFFSIQFFFKCLQISIKIKSFLKRKFLQSHQFKKHSSSILLTHFILLIEILHLLTGELRNATLRWKISKRRSRNDYTFWRSWLTICWRCCGSVFRGKLTGVPNGFPSGSVRRHNIVFPFPSPPSTSIVIAEVQIVL